MLKLRAYSVACPCCRNAIEVSPPDSLVVEQTGLTHRCSWCRRWLVMTVSQPGPMRIPEVRIIGPSDRSLALNTPGTTATGRQSAAC